MNNINFFGWIRDGVRQSVLLGVSDAIDQLGTPPTADQLHPGVVAFLQNGPADNRSNILADQLPGTQRTATANRKRLGRSLKDIEPSVQK
jgi:hypothetical protein